MTITVTTPPASEPISVVDVKQHSRITGADDDAYVLNLIRAAREQVESHTRRALITQTITERRDDFPCFEWHLHRTPVQSITSVQYVDANGDTQTWNSALYETDLVSSDMARIRPVDNATWPGVKDQWNAVTAVYVAGYGDVKNVPKSIRQAMLMMVDHWYEHRSDVTELRLEMTPNAVKHLLNPYRVIRF